MLESPIIRFEIESPLTTREVVIRLQNVTGPPPIVRFIGAWGKRQKFDGVVTDDCFDLRRILDGRNSFNPRASGRVETVDGHALLKGTMKLDAFILPFLFSFNGFVAVMFAVQVLLGLAMAAFGSALMLTVGIVVFLLIPGFVSEARTTANHLAKVVDATRTQLYSPPIEGQWRFIARIRELESPLREDRSGTR
jgi:hypothetical protein